MYKSTLTVDGWGFETPSSTWAILFMTKSVISCLSSSTCSPISGMELSITCGDSETASHHIPDYNSSVSPLDGGVLSLMREDGTSSGPWPEEQKQSLVLCQEWWVIFRGISDVSPDNAVQAFSAIYCRMHWAWHGPLYLFPCTVTVHREALVLGLLYYITLGVALELLNKFESLCKWKHKMHDIIERSES